MVETLKNHQYSMTTSEYAKNWTEKSPNSKLKEITSTLDNPKLSKFTEVKNLKNYITNHNYREFQKLVGVPYIKCDGKIGPESLSYFNNYINKLTKQNKTFTQTNSYLSNLQGNIGQIENLMDTIHIQNNEAQYLATYKTMSQNEYNRLFSGRENLQQGQLGDCYLVSSINQLTRAQHFDTLMRTSIQRVKWKDGSGSGYQIKIPLGEPTGRKILFKDSELSLAQIRGNIGYKLLELAYAKNKLRKNDKQGNTYRPITSGELSKIEGGRMKEVFESFLGKNNIGFNTFGDKNRKNALNTIPQTSKNQLTGFLKNYTSSIGNKFVSLSSIGGKSDSDKYTIGGKTMYHKHAYALTGVNKDSNGNIKSITVLNPRNKKGDGKNYLNFTLDEFFQAFSFISCGKIRTNTFLDSKGVS